MIAALLLAATVVPAPPGLDSRHIPMGSPLGAMPIVISPGETLRQLQAPLTEAQWLRQRRAAIARAEKTPQGRALARRLAEIARNVREMEASGPPSADPAISPPHP